MPAWVVGSAVAAAVVGAALWMPAATAQESAKPSGEQQKPAPPRVNIDARDADVRETLTDLFKQAKISNYSIASNVYGTVNVSLKDRAFEEALTLIARVASPPLAWTKTEGFYEVKLRTVRPRSAAQSVAPSEEEGAVTLHDGTRLEVIRLQYADARDITAALSALRPPDLHAAVAYEPLNRVLTQWGPPAFGAGPPGAGGFVSGVIGAFPNQNRSGSAGASGPAPNQAPARPGAGSGLLPPGVEPIR